MEIYFNDIADTFSYGVHIAYWVSRKKGCSSRTKKTLYIVALTLSITFIIPYFIGSMFIIEELSKNSESESLYNILIILTYLIMAIAMVGLIISAVFYSKDKRKYSEIHSHTKGKMIKKYDLITRLVVGLSGVCIITAAIGGMTKIMALVYSFGIVGIAGFIYGCLMIQGRKKICPNCGDCVGKTIDTKFMGTDVKTRTRQISENEYRHEQWKTNVDITKNHDGTYSETTTQNIHHYEHTLQCEKCGHIWTIGENKKS